MIRLFTNADEGRAFILARRDMREAELSPRMREGVRRVFGADLSAEQVVARILTDVRERGDEALRHYTRAIDGVELDLFGVDAAEIDAAYRAVDPAVIEALEFAAMRI